MWVTDNDYKERRMREPNLTHTHSFSLPNMLISVREMVKRVSTALTGEWDLSPLNGGQKIP